MARLQNVLLIASLLSGLGFYFFELGLGQSALAIVLKGGAVSLLAGFALLCNRSDDGRLLATVLFLGAAGDIAIEFGIIAGALLFLVGHLVAIWLYCRNRRSALSASQKLLAAALIVIVPFVAFELPDDRSLAPLVTLYSLGLAAMAATAWISRFSRYRFGFGAILFVASDLLIFARMGPLAGTPVPALTIWPLYYLGQLLICLGVLSGLKGDQLSD